MSNLHIFLLAGVQTKDSAFTTLTDRLNTLLTKKGVNASIELLYPYGDYNRKIWRQVLDICFDFNFISKKAGLGGRRIKNEIAQSVKYGNNKFLLIGHSGGGVAAYRLARFLHFHFNVELEKLRVVQIGSPKIRVAPQFQQQLSYIQAMDELGKLKDPITRIGHWGGLQLKKMNKKGWNTRKYAPSLVHTIPIIGGHTDYLRVNAPFIDAHQRSNLDYTFGVIENWLNDWI